MRSTSLQLFDTRVRIDNYNDHFLLLTAGESAQLPAIGNAIYQRKLDFVEEVIVTEVEICLQLNERFDESKLSELAAITKVSVPSAKTFRLPVFFDEQEDWQHVTDHCGLDKAQFIQELVETDFTLAMFGFIPGFLYLRGLPERLQVPRKKVPAKYVAGGSIALGGPYLGCYALDSPGGWQVIGRTPLQILQLPDWPPLALRPGDKIRLQTIDRETFEKLTDSSFTLTEYNA